MFLKVTYRLVIFFSIYLFFLVGFDQVNAQGDVKERATSFLARVGLTIPPQGVDEDKWITLCEVKARIADAGIKPKTDTQTCTKTANGEILETRVVRREEWRCSWSTESYASGTLLNYQNTIINQYDSAIKIAAEAGDKAAVDYMESMKRQHNENLQVATNRDAAKLTATATSAGWWKSGANCDLVLEGRVRRLI
ncbi:unnamed protein product [Adineta ricciae]|uniref:DUF1311 domain-containing protein n=1 Tax=Adineta ricciae TaxID=249248 RepID=A0A814BBT0_ADIRI|nr:unnamed protein product [Adineta ricciae]CAF1460933.1 unnamed protein product [Adineta ricciae]